MPKVVRYRLRELMAEKERLIAERLTYLMISEATGISRNTLSSMGAQQLERIPAHAVAKLCEYFDCEPGDLIILQDMPNSDER